MWSICKRVSIMLQAGVLKIQIKQAGRCATRDIAPMPAAHVIAASPKMRVIYRLTLSAATGSSRASKKTAATVKQHHNRPIHHPTQEELLWGHMQSVAPTPTCTSTIPSSHSAQQIGAGGTSPSTMVHSALDSSSPSASSPTSKRSGSSSACLIS